jgi:hypothetical protein
MSELIDLVTREGNINMLDRVGGTINVTIEGVDLTTTDLWFESGSVSLELTGDEDLKSVSIAPEDLTIIVEEKATKYAIIDKTPVPDKVIWEGYIFIRSLD